MGDNNRNTIDKRNVNSLNRINNTNAINNQNEVATNLRHIGVSILDHRQYVSRFFANNQFINFEYI